MPNIVGSVGVIFITLSLGAVESFMVMFSDLLPLQIKLSCAIKVNVKFPGNKQLCKTEEEICAENAVLLVSGVSVNINSSGQFRLFRLNCELDNTSKLILSFIVLLCLVRSLAVYLVSLTVTLM